MNKITQLFVEEVPNQKLYTINIIETLKRKVEVYAEDEDNAISKVEDAWNKCDVILDAEDFTGVKFKVSKVRELNEVEKIEEIEIDDEEEENVE